MTKKYKHSYMEIDNLIPYANNSRTHSAEQVNQVASSIKEFGFTNPVLIDEQGGIIAGHGRVMAAKKLGLAEVPCITLEGLTEAQKKAYIIADNQLPLNAGWDLDKLQLEIEALKELDFDIDLLGFDGDFLNDLLPEEEVEGLTDEDEVPEPPEQPVSVLGDIWLLGNHRLMCGDSTSIDAVEKLMNGKKADMVFTDPPYGISLDTDYVSNSSVKGNTYKKIKDDDKEFDASFLVEYFGKIEQFWWGANYYQDTLPKGGSWVVWDKSNEQQDKAIGSSFEICYSTIKHKNSFYRKLWKGFTAKERGESRVHPTQKPVEMVVWFFEQYGKKCNVIVDNFSGSGTTIMAAEKAKKSCYGMEFDGQYVDVIINRWQNFTGKKATLESTGETYEELKQKRIVSEVENAS